MANKYVIDFQSETWRAIEDRANLRLEELRKRNDGDLSAEQTAKVRGRIAELKDLLTLAQPAPALVADE